MQVEEMQEPDIPVTILTGFLGAGKTTLLNRILTEDHKHRIAIIENEFGPENIDNELIVQSDKEQIVSMNNGCVCCTIRGDLSRVLTDLRHKRDRGEIAFDYVVIETTGVANPGPVAQTFFMDDAVAPYFRLDGVVTVVDAKHGSATLDAEAPARDQVGFADRILLSKCDLVTEEEASALEARLRQMNARAPIRRVDMGKCPVEEVLDISGFNMNDVLDVDPTFFNEGHHHHHDDDIHSFVFDTDRAFDPMKLERYFMSLTSVYGEDLLRYKGVLNLQGSPNRVVVQGVHMLAVSDVLGPWGDRKPTSRLVFIGRNLPEEAIRRGLQTCLV
ncbi:CobW family GTP-binding protein [Sutterella megalosphaeroides]|uniref:Cobalamin biosynthesis protein CobW n=1 Tax=Sutterella megalosphaeroides TaxID=2494234 RepID=A0A2Z6I774_9BURK|nr:GTP-binding protein [Sutterella megalosphaeroides]BBF22233.1 cobalamin biosynthesis protein CobW [Sutterella megalosphaeroides]